MEITSRIILNDGKITLENDNIIMFNGTPEELAKEEKGEAIKSFIKVMKIIIKRCEKVIKK